MNRLTMESDKSGLAFTFDLDVTCKKEEMLKILKIGNALKEYEDLGLTPEQIREVDQLYAEKCKEVAELRKSPWIPVTERLPKNETEVEVTIERRYCSGEVRRFTCRAIHEDGKMTTEESDYGWDDAYEYGYEYNEETDSYIIPEGWYEQNLYCDESRNIDDHVIAWMPLPKPYVESVKE